MKSDSDNSPLHIGYKLHFQETRPICLDTALPTRFQTPTFEVDDLQKFCLNFQLFITPIPDDADPDSPIAGGKLVAYPDASGKHWCIYQETARPSYTHDDLAILGIINKDGLIDTHRFLEIVQCFTDCEEYAPSSQQLFQLVKLGYSIHYVSRILRAPEAPFERLEWLLCEPDLIGDETPNQQSQKRIEHKTKVLQWVRSVRLESGGLFDRNKCAQDYIQLGLINPITGQVNDLRALEIRDYILANWQEEPSFEQLKKQASFKRE